MRLWSRFGNRKRGNVGPPKDRESNRFGEKHDDGQAPATSHQKVRYYEQGGGFITTASEVVINFNGMTVQELKDYMDANGIDRTGLTLKSELIAAIEAV